MLREEYEKETGNKCPEDVFDSVDYYHYERGYSKWLESKFSAENTKYNSEYKSALVIFQEYFNISTKLEFGDWLRERLNQQS